MINFSIKKINIFIIILSVIFVLLSVFSILNFGKTDFFRLLFQALISLQILTVFFGQKINILKQKFLSNAKYFSFFLLVITAIYLALFIISVVEFGVNKNGLLLYQIFIPMLIISILIIIFPIHLKLIK